MYVSIVSPSVLLFIFGRPMHTAEHAIASHFTPPTPATIFYPCIGPWVRTVLLIITFCFAWHTYILEFSLSFPPEHYVLPKSHNKAIFLEAHPVHTCLFDMFSPPSPGLVRFPSLPFSTPIPPFFAHPLLVFRFGFSFLLSRLNFGW